MKKVRQDLQGKQFGRLTVLEYACTNKHGKAMWSCRCECGRETIVSGCHLVNSHTTSCGCWHDEAASKRLKTHGMRNTRLYRLWLGMKSRCDYDYKNNSRYHGRGIKVCDEWRDFTAFHDWAMANGYQDGLSIERADVDGNYCPENCRWITRKEQANNKSTSVFVEAFGQKKTLKEWSEITGINYNTLHSRYKARKTLDELFAGAQGVKTCKLDISQTTMTCMNGMKRSSTGS